MARVAPMAANSLSTLSLSSNNSLIDPRLLNSNNNNNENEEVWEVNLKNTYTNANIPRLVNLNRLKRRVQKGKAAGNNDYEIAMKAVKNEEKRAMSMFNKKSRSRRSARRLTRRRR